VAQSLSARGSGVTACAAEQGKRAEKPVDRRTGRLSVLRFGIEAPYVPAGLTAAGVLSLILGFFSPWLFVVAALFLAQAALYLHTTIRGKLLVWEDLLDGLNLQGTEQALDLGCGRGPVLLALARRLSRGRAVGVDLWRSRDQTGNAEDVTRANAAAEGVGPLVELRTADMTSLPFDDGSFDVVASALAIHNIPTAQGRAAAVTEALRVLRPGGQMILVHFRHAADYADVLKELGARDVQVRKLGARYWYGSPVTAGSAVSATRP
jgi:ubiquinone/menaquinone biosynthesis C-methylase UbiE